ncbi:putative ATP-grasp-modified RiPP [Planomonospora sp. ID82291]|uniref:putative ATP-grasp-modified RiPP n=1 Tax=Planomonospora sp. ID82291 TaxID=2738136 RepID=UPI0018C382C9|nr:putative ATP-grasp-modified RiPP [Planomonospora sp. ID82291]MBG0818605.1 putative ATP-grasp-modified RiPP [Planomonospora sp. ID82291]
MTTATAWGLAQATEPLPKDGPLYATAVLDPATQLARFYDAAGAIVDMGDKKKAVTVTKSKGGGGDGSGKSNPVADDSNSDG